MRKLARVVEPEWLDDLPPDDPGARRSRRDLRRLDFLLGASQSVVDGLRGRLRQPRLLVELGAGEGRLCRRLSGEFPGAVVTGCDLVGRPAGLPERVRWLRGDMFQTLPGVAADAFVGALILHHFEEAGLRRLGLLLAGARLLVFVEPLRGRVPLSLSALLFPFISPVTRHDMPVSIRAGFVEGELAGALGLGGEWKISESRGRFGTLRMVAWRR